MVALILVFVGFTAVVAIARCSSAYVSFCRVPNFGKSLGVGMISQASMELHLISLKSAIVAYVIEMHLVLSTLESRA